MICFALIADPNVVDPGLLSAVAGALQIQVSRDVAPAPPNGWGVGATVVAAPVGQSSPNGAWPIYITNQVSNPQAFGYHTAYNGQPFGIVQLVPEPVHWAFYASHELLEMLIDPFGSSLRSAPSIDPDPSRHGSPVSYLLEICDPVQQPNIGYAINGFVMSNFVLPPFFDPPAGLRCDRLGLTSGPLSLLPGGTITWGDPQIGSWMEYQAGAPQASQGPPLSGPPPGMSAEEFAQLSPREYVHKAFGHHLLSEPINSVDLKAFLKHRERSQAAREAELAPSLAWLEAARAQAS